MKYIKAWLAIVGLLAAFILVAPAPAQAAPYCGITWGSLAKTAGTGSSATVTNVRAGQHACFDRMVIDVNGHANGYSVQYVSVVQRPGSGQAVPVRGAADLQVTVLAPPTPALALPATPLPTVTNSSIRPVTPPSASWLWQAASKAAPPSR